MNNRFSSDIAEHSCNIDNRLTDISVLAFQHRSFNYMHGQFFDVSQDRSDFGESNSCYPLCSITFNTLQEKQNTWNSLAKPFSRRGFLAGFRLSAWRRKAWRPSGVLGEVIAITQCVSLINILRPSPFHCGAFLKYQNFKVVPVVEQQQGSITAGSAFIDKSACVVTHNSMAQPEVISTQQLPCGDGK